jgi:hypothetical protein
MTGLFFWDFVDAKVDKFLEMGYVFACPIPLFFGKKTLSEGSESAFPPPKGRKRLYNFWLSWFNLNVPVK